MRQIAAGRLSHAVRPSNNRAGARGAGLSDQVEGEATLHCSLLCSVLVLVLHGGSVLDPSTADPAVR